YVAIAWFYRRVARWSPPMWLPVATGTAWTAIEVARVRVIGGLPWGLLGYTQQAIPSVIQIADITGVFGVTFLVAMVNASVVEVVLASRRSMAGAAAMRMVSVAVILVALSISYGHVRLTHLSRLRGSDGVAVVTVQPNADYLTHWLTSSYKPDL